jgi:hypothetical protein
MPEVVKLQVIYSRTATEETVRNPVVFFRENHEQISLLDRAQQIVVEISHSLVQSSAGVLMMRTYIYLLQKVAEV